MKKLCTLALKKKIIIIFLLLNRGKLYDSENKIKDLIEGTNEKILN